MLFTGSALLAISYAAGHRGMAEYTGDSLRPGERRTGGVAGSDGGCDIRDFYGSTVIRQDIMGDTGSLPLGGVIGLSGLVTKQEALLAIIGGVFVVETLSVIAGGLVQVDTSKIARLQPVTQPFFIQGRSRDEDRGAVLDLLGGLGDPGGSHC